MNTDELIERLLTELNMTQISLAQEICDHETALGAKGFRNIAINWLSKAHSKPSLEFEAGTTALRNYFMMIDSKESLSAVSLLLDEDEDFYDVREYAKTPTVGIKRNKPARLYRRAQDSLRQDYIPSDYLDLPINYLNIDTKIHGTTMRG
jgi:hypothetical protein